MSLVLKTSLTAMAPGLSTNIVAQGGVEPYVYSIVAGGAGGSIVAGADSDADYTAPAIAPTNPAQSSVTLMVTDDDGDTATATILIADVLGLVCEIIQKETGLDPGRVYLWDQKIMQPKDSGVYVAVGVLNCKPFGNTTKVDGSGSGLDAVQTINMLATLSIDVISRGTEAIRFKEQVLLALNSLYSQSQQTTNSFYVGALPPAGQFVNLSNPDGAAIPYRFNISINVQYFARKVKAVPYFDEFEDVEVTTEP